MGLQNKGVDYFCEHIYPQIKDIRTNMIVNVSGSCCEDYAGVPHALTNWAHSGHRTEHILSEREARGMAFGVTARRGFGCGKAVRKAYDKTLIVKLSPNVTNVAEHSP